MRSGGGQLLDIYMVNTVAADHQAAQQSRPPPDNGSGTDISQSFTP